ncbi:MAG: pantetheine-phosphate adenylyltransferase [Lachnospiraceae bacterium]|nr:pantetheine-phosphate adenylyltransferase [Lachnospiraceae bacterium]
MRRAVYPGTFDPVTNGHLDIIRRAAQQFDEVVVGVLCNSKKSPLFSIDERVRMLQEVTKDIPGVRVDSFDGMTVNFVRACGAGVIIRGLRAVTDFENELQMAQTNRVIAPDIDTMLMVTSLEYAYLSSTIVKELASHGEAIERFVPPYAAEKIKEKYKEIIQK